MSVLTPGNEGAREFVAVRLKEKSFLPEASKRHCPYLPIALRKLSGWKFPRHAQHQSCIRTELGSAPSWDGEGAVNSTWFQGPPCDTPARLPSRKPLNVSASNVDSTAAQKPGWRRRQLGARPHQSTATLILRSSR